MSLSAWNDVCLSYLDTTTSYLSRKSILEASASAVQLSSNSMPAQP